MRLRLWQRAALSQFEDSAAPDFLVVATPGAGNTTFALSVARRALVARTIRRVVMVVPTEHLKYQWAQAAERLDIHLDPEWTMGYGGLPSDVHGVVVTYQQVAMAPAAFASTWSRQSLVILDEIHHAGDSRSWGDGIRQAFDPAWRRLCLSGTPFRSDQMTIPFVTYEGELARPDFEYGFGDALADGNVVRPVYFPRINGRMEWTAPDGVGLRSHVRRPTRAPSWPASVCAPRSCISGEWMPPTVLARARAALAPANERSQRRRSRDRHRSRARQGDRGDHGRARLGVSPTVATSDDPGASEKISRFTNGHRADRIVRRCACQCSEGVDIPRAAHGRRLRDRTP